MSLTSLRLSLCICESRSFTPKTATAVPGLFIQCTLYDPAFIVFSTISWAPVPEGGPGPGTLALRGGVTCSQAKTKLYWCYPEPHSPLCVASFHWITVLTLEELPLPLKFPYFLFRLCGKVIPGGAVTDPPPWASVQRLWQGHGSICT